MHGRFLIGPMGKLGWGTPTLISLEIGVILEIPRPAFAIVGVLRVALPAEDVAILNLQVNFVGTVDFERRQLYIRRLAIRFTCTHLHAHRRHGGADLLG